jgi:hypothetical protein
MAAVAIPNLRDEGSGGNARASRYAIQQRSWNSRRVTREGDSVGKERYTGNVHFSGLRPIPIRVAGFQGLYLQTLRETSCTYKPCDKDESGFYFWRIRK